MKIEDCRIGMEVIFGRGNGQHTRGKVIKINRAKAKVQTIEDRGNTTAGTVWSVPYSLMEPADSNVEYSKDLEYSKPKPQPIAYSVFQDPVEQHILEAIAIVYNHLSPENLTGDGELPAYVVREKSAKLNRQLRGLFQALGREVDEVTVYNWSVEKMATLNKETSNA